MQSTACWWILVTAATDADLIGVLRQIRSQPEVTAQWLAADATPEAGRGVLMPVDPAEIDMAIRRVAAWRRAQPAMTVLCLGRALAPAQEAALLEAGAHECLRWPCRPAALVQRLHSAPVDAGAPRIRGFVYASPECARIAQQLPAIAGCDASVMIIGETGTGKEVCAQAVHYLSRRSAGPWVAVNCAAIPAELMESELFGHVKGAYTTALATRAGLVREAEGGTLFLDDIDCLPLQAQGKLLRFLQEFEYRPVGANAVQRANVRVVAASNRELRVLAHQGSFRQDLFFRLSVLRIALPPLRQRQGDTELLAHHFVRELAGAGSRLAHARLSEGALARLLAHDWPGNVRELRHVIERAVLLAQGPDIEAHDIEIDCEPGGERDGDARAPDIEPFQAAKKRVVDAFERRYIEELLARHHGNVTHAANAARKNRRAFFELIRKHGIDANCHRGAP